MAIKVIQSDRDWNVYQYVVDSVDDLKLIPNNQEGSFALICDTGDVYVLSPSLVWVKL